MDEITLEQGVTTALTALHSDRLALLCGAGLSMAAPSNLPNAAQLAASAQGSYRATYGATRPPLPDKLEDQAELFFRSGDLATVYLRTLIGPHPFAAPPNVGHSAIADLLLVRGIQTAISTNVDTLIETAGMMLFGQVGVGVSKDEVAALPPDMSPLLKLHGCWSRNPANTIWAPGQLTLPEVTSRLSGCAEWLAIRLLDRDMIVVGFFTDWDYLNDVLDRTLGAVRPARVLIVDPDDAAALAGKAPALHALGERATSQFSHVRQSGAAFLETLRIEFSRSFVRRVLDAGREGYRELKSTVAEDAWLEPPSIDADSFWRMRRDLEGCRPGEPASARVPPAEPVLGLVILQLRAAGAVPDGPYWLLNGRRIRILRMPNQLLHEVQAAFARETPPPIGADVVVAVGAQALGLPASIARATGPSTIARGTTGRWLTALDAIAEFTP